MMLRWSFYLQKGDYSLFKTSKMFKQKERKKEELIKELKKGEKSEMIRDFDRDSFIKNLHKKYLKNYIISN